MHICAFQTEHLDTQKALAIAEWPSAAVGGAYMSPQRSYNIARLVVVSSHCSGLVARIFVCRHGCLIMQESPTEAILGDTFCFMREIKRCRCFFFYSRLMAVQRKFGEVGWCCTVDPTYQNL